MPDLSNFKTIRSNLFITIDIPNYEVINFSDYFKPYTLDGVLYDNLGSLLSVSYSQSEIRASKNELTISISGIPPENVSAITQSDFKGSNVIIKRGFFNVQTGELINLPGNPANKFIGIANNYGLNETIDQISKYSTFTISIICTNVVGLLDIKKSGRRTNPMDEKILYPSDLSMDRVPDIKNSNFNFGAPKDLIRIGTS